MTLVVFVLLCVKYAEVAIRYPEGGGVVTVATRAIHPFAGLVGSLLILVDYQNTYGPVLFSSAVSSDSWAAVESVTTGPAG